jgi:mRNA interferase MazF
VNLPLPPENEKENKTKKFRELEGDHPAAVVSNDEQNKFSPLITILPLTSQVDKIYPFQVESYLQGKRGVILVDQIRTIDRQRIGDRIGQFDELMLAKIEKALHITLALKN